MWQFKHLRGELDPVEEFSSKNGRNLPIIVRYELSQCGWKRKTRTLTPDSNIFDGLIDTIIDLITLIVGRYSN